MHEINHLLEGIERGQTLTGNLLLRYHHDMIALYRVKLGKNLIIPDHIQRLLAVIENKIGVGDFQGADVNIALLNIDRHIDRARVAHQHINIRAVVHHAERSVVDIEIAGCQHALRVLCGRGVHLELVHMLDQLVIRRLALFRARYLAAEDFADRIVIALQLLGRIRDRHLDHLDFCVLKLLQTLFVDLVGSEHNFRFRVNNRVDVRRVCRADLGRDRQKALVNLGASADKLAVVIHV